MLGSTNHLDRLDPGIAKRPSRFDRKYYFPNPDRPQRVQYAQFWQAKLKSNKHLDFPDALCHSIAGITHDFSFAYMQEAFVATLLAIASRGGTGVDEAERWAGPQDPMTRVNAEVLLGRYSRAHGGSGARNPDLDNLPLWIEMQKQVKILREEMDDEADGMHAAKRRNLSGGTTTTITSPTPPKTRAGMASKSPLSGYRDELDAVLHEKRYQSEFERLLASMKANYALD